MSDHHKRAAQSLFGVSPNMAERQVHVQHDTAGSRLSTCTYLPELPESIWVRILASLKDGGWRARGLNTVVRKVVEWSRLSISLRLQTDERTGLAPDVTPLLKRLTALKAVSLSRASEGESRKGTMDLSDVGLALRGIPNLRGLTLPYQLNSHPCTWVSPIPHLTGLTKLDIRVRRWHLKHGMTFDTLPVESIQQLSLWDDIQDLSGLSGATALTYLALHKCPHTTIQALHPLQLLCSLNLRGCTSLVGVSCLTAFTALTTLVLDDCKAIRSLQFLEGMPQLKRLGCYQMGEHIDVVPNFSAQTNLELLELGLFKSHHLEMQHLACLTSLTELRLSRCYNFARHRWCDGTGRVDASPLTALQRLKILDLSHCDVTTQSAQAVKSALTSLEVLDLFYCGNATDLAIPYSRNFCDKEIDWEEGNVRMLKWSFP